MMPKDKWQGVIAKARGWIDKGSPGFADANYCRYTAPDGSLHKELPNYLRDLNAMHRAEDLLTDEQWPEYREHLRTVVLGPTRMTSDWCKADLHATAEQKAEAFIRTLFPEDL
jgi:hypothetical protein